MVGFQLGVSYEKVISRRLERQRVGADKADSGKSQKGILEQIYHILRKESRILRGRDPEPSAGIVDSQFAKTTEKGASEDMMVERKLRVGKSIYLLTLRD